ncbi:LysR family transcriptional regulator [Sorangium sp. So ce448]|uniref:LysR family transcriptional regulator n=1 Tax=Sorangium sp. So ce448 TaxID=3133314 RepID=UPI003F632DDC
MIQNITVVNLSTIDLNLLHVLAVTLEERSATRAARRLGVTQSAVSNALARARELLGDPLLVRDGRGMAPTPTADELLPELAAAMGQLRSMIEHRRVFDPRSSTRELTLACADNSQIADVPPVAAALAREMPLARLRVVSVDYLVASGGMSAGGLDAAIGVHKRDPGLRVAPLYRDPTVGVVRHDHPIVGQRLTRGSFPRLGFIDVHIPLGRPGRGHAMVEQALRAQGLVRRIALVVPGFAAATMAAAASDLVAFMPRRVAVALGSHLPVRIVELPVKDLGHEISLAWHERTHKDPAAACLRKVIVETLRAAGGGGCDEAPQMKRQQRRHDGGGSGGH